MSKCLFCYKELEEGQIDLTPGRVSSRSAISSELDGSRLTRDFHPACARKFFGSTDVPIIPYTRDNMSELARQVIRTSASVTGVQAKMSLDVNRGSRKEPAKFTIVGLWGKYIFKPQSGHYPCLPELEDLTMKMADPADTEEMAMTFTVGGQKIGFDRNTFMTAFTQSGIPVAVASKMIDRMKRNLPVWEELISQSFLPDKMKAAYCDLLRKRISRL